MSSLDNAEQISYNLVCPKSRLALLSLLSLPKLELPGAILLDQYTVTKSLHIKISKITYSTIVVV